MKGNNESIPFTIRTVAYLSNKQRAKDSKLAKRLIYAWDKKQNSSMLLSVFLKEKATVSDYSYWEFLRSVWIMSGGNENEKIFRVLFGSKRKHVSFFMTPEEEKYFSELPEIITVHRACNEGYENGLAWTISLDYALSYQKMFFKEKIVAKKVPKSSCFAYINRNNEKEIVIL